MSDVRTTPSDSLTEEGISVFKVSDYEFYAGRSREEAVGEAFKDWGCIDEAEAIRDGCFEPNGVEACDLDRMKVNTSEDDEAPNLITFRESIKRRLAEGVVFPVFFAGFDI